MLRTDVKNRVNELAQKYEGLDLDLLGMYKAIFEGKPPYRKGRYELKDGCLYIDNKFVGRFAPKRETKFDEMSYYIEGRILARQGM